VSISAGWQKLGNPSASSAVFGCSPPVCSQRFRKAFRKFHFRMVYQVVIDLVEDLVARLLGKMVFDLGFYRSAEIGFCFDLAVRVNGLKILRSVLLFLPGPLW
jgi:hypothetical protein